MRAFFNSCLSDLKLHLKSLRIDIQENDAIEIGDAAGDFFLVPFSIAGLGLNEIKQICEDFEENHPLGRFVDVDLNDLQGNTVSSGKSKLCFFCREKPAIECRRKNAHSFDELRTFMFSEMAEYCRKQREERITERLSSLAQRRFWMRFRSLPSPDWSISVAPEVTRI